MHLPPLDVAVFPIVTMSYGYNGNYNNNNGSSLPPISSISTAPSYYAVSSPSQLQYHNQISTPTPIYPPDAPEFSSVQELARRTLRDRRAALHQVERLSGQFHRLYLLNLHDGRRMVLKCLPASTIRLMRHEQHSLETESTVLEFITRNTGVPVPAPLIYDGSNHPGSSSSSRQHQRGESTSSPSALTRASGSSSTNPLNAPFLLRSFLPGTPLSSCAARLLPATRAHIDRTIGLHLSALSNLRARGFGPARRVFAGRGAATWREAFLSLLEAALRDAEDLLVSLPYGSVREWAQVAARAGVLDGVREACFVGLDFGCEPNVLVDEASGAVVGMLGAGNAVFGDPLMAAVWEGAPVDVWRGFGRQEAPVEGGVESVRMYSMYRAVVSVVAHYYRPRAEQAELEARRALTGALNQLASLQHIST
ncbi:hypothetical protein BDY21DRAFT_384622 [Lineolata rhizophorae]|uniref:Aminoglycoside phosphotransferase domain-containing protein n=1 Tax=Lineolata rhizophorae TaxID=578093 RepID=A0A6A6P5W9_9PEZI|nr:hypothetical protein BDY21DRAFT_384622 [Lineolata rhizophorae]